MSDVARKTGLGRSTVSMALRNHPEISATTRARVIQAAKELGYQPNPLVSLLMSRLHDETHTRRDTVLAVISEPTENWSWRQFPFFQAMWAGIAEQASRRGYLIEEFQVGAYGLPAGRLRQILISRGIPGILLAPKLATGPSDFVGWEDLAAVTLNWSITTPGLSRACVDCFHNFNRAWDALEARGYRRIGFINNPGQSIRLHHQYLAANLAKLELSPPERRVAPLSLSSDQMTGAALRDWLRRERPDAVLLSYGGPTAKLLQEVASVPDELGAAALELSNAPDGMSGIDDHVGMIGTAAVDLLIGRLQRNERGPAEPARLLHVAGVWRDGNSTRPPKE